MTGADHARETRTTSGGDARTPGALALSPVARNVAVVPH